MQTELQALVEVLGRAKVLKRSPDRGRQVVAAFRIRQSDRSRCATFIKSVAYTSGLAGGGGGCEVEVETVDRPGYVTCHFGDGPEQALAAAGTDNDGWGFEPGSLTLLAAHGFSKPDKAALVGALEALLTLRFC
jgi:hypothetical protein